MVVDDSALMRRLLTDLLSTSPEIEVVGTARDGRDAVLQATRLRPDVITLDVEMPEVSGLDALPSLLAIGGPRGCDGERADAGRGGRDASGARAGGVRLPFQAREEPAWRDSHEGRPLDRQGAARRRQRPALDSQAAAQIGGRAGGTVARRGARGGAEAETGRCLAEIDGCSGVDGYGRAAVRVDWNLDGWAAGAQPDLPRAAPSRRRRSSSCSTCRPSTPGSSRRGSIATLR